MKKKPKHLNMLRTYVKDIRNLDVQYKGLKLVLSRTAAQETLRYGFMLRDCKEILENGYEPRKRAKNTTEKWLDKGKKTYNVVVVKDYNNILKEEARVVIHFGMFTKRKKPQVWVH